MRIVLNLILAVLLSGGNLAAAGLKPHNAGTDILTINQWMKHLNNNYDRLNVAAKTDLLVPSNRASTIEELEILEDYLQGEVELNNAALKSLKCGRPVCDGGDRL